MATITGLTAEGMLELVADIQNSVVTECNLRVEAANVYTDQKTNTSIKASNNYTDIQTTFSVEAAQIYTDTIASGKNKIYFEDTPPVGGIYIDGDLWFDKSNGNKMYTRDGNAWRSFETPITIPDLSITVAKFKTSTHQLY